MPVQRRERELTRHRWNPGDAIFDSVACIDPLASVETRMQKCEPRIKTGVMFKQRRNKTIGCRVLDPARRRLFFLVLPACGPPPLPGRLRRLTTSPRWGEVMG